MKICGPLWFNNAVTSNAITFERYLPGQASHHLLLDLPGIHPLSDNLVATHDLSLRQTRSRPDASRENHSGLYSYR